MNVFDLAAKITLDSKDYESGLSKAATLSKGAASKLGNGLKTAGRIGAKAFGAVSAGAGVLTAVMGKTVKSTVSYGDRVGKMSKKMGISAKAFQEWDAILEHSGASIDSLKPSMKTLATAAQKNDKAFKQLGITQEELKKLNQEQLFERVIAELQEMDKGTERTYLTSKLLGRGATELGALLDTSAKDTEKMRKEVHKLGGVMSDEAVKASEKLQDSIQDMRTGFDGIKRNIGEMLMPQFQEFITFATKGISKISKVFKKSGLNASMQEFGNFIAEGLTRLVNKAPDMVKQGASLLEGIARGITQNKKTVGRALSKMISAIADVLPDMVGSIVDLITALIDELAKKSGKIIDKIIGAIKKLIDKLLETGKDGKSRIEKIINSIFDLVVNSVTSFVNKLPELTPKIVSLISELLKSIFKNANKITSGLSGIISDIIESITNGISQLISDAPELLSDLVTALAKSLPELLKAGIQGTIALFTSVVQLIPELLKLPVTLTASLLSGLSDAWADQNLSGDAKKNFKKYLKGIFGNGTDEVASETEERSKKAFGGTFGKMSANITEGSNSVGQLAYDGTYAIGQKLGTGFVEGQPKGFKKGWAYPMFNEVKGAINIVASLVHQGIEGIWNKIIEFFKTHSLVRVGYNMGTQIVNGIVEGIKAGLKNLTTGGLFGTLGKIMSPTPTTTTNNSSKAVNVSVTINNPSVRNNNDIQTLTDSINTSLGQLFRQREVAYG